MHYVDTPDWKKFCGAHDTALEIGQDYVNKKLKELIEMGDEKGKEYRKKKGNTQSIVAADIHRYSVVVLRHLKALLSLSVVSAITSKL